MEFLYLVTALVTVGVSFAGGLTSLFSGSFKKGVRLGLIFGSVLLCLFVWALITPVAFFGDDRIVYTWQLTMPPFNFFPFLFMVIIVIRARIEIIEKLRPEKNLWQREIGWNSLIQNLKLM